MPRPVPNVPVVEDVPEVMILPEFWRKTIGIVPDFAHVLFVVGGSGTTYEINLSTSDNPDQTVVIPYIPQSLQFQADQARRVPALDLMRSMMQTPFGGQV
jgi:hypothetical protein